MMKCSKVIKKDKFLFLSLCTTLLTGSFSASAMDPLMDEDLYRHAVACMKGYASSSNAIEMSDPMSSSVSSLASVTEVDSYLESPDNETVRYPFGFELSDDIARDPSPWGSPSSSYSLGEEVPEGVPAHSGPTILQSGWQFISFVWTKISSSPAAPQAGPEAQEYSGFADTSASYDAEEDTSRKKTESNSLMARSHPFALTRGYPWVNGTSSPFAQAYLVASMFNRGSNTPASLYFTLAAKGLQFTMIPKPRETSRIQDVLSSLTHRTAQNIGKGVSAVTTSLSIPSVLRFGSPLPLTSTVRRILSSVPFLTSKITPVPTNPRAVPVVPASTVIPISTNTRAVPVVDLTSIVVHAPAVAAPAVHQPTVNTTSSAPQGKKRASKRSRIRKGKRSSRVRVSRSKRSRTNLRKKRVNVRKKRVNVRKKQVRSQTNRRSRALRAA